MNRLLVVVLLAVLATGCGGPRLQDHAATTPALDLFAYFDGEVRGHGLVQSRNGELLRRFTVDITGTVAGDTLTLDERFVYDDGETQRRVWTITRQPDGSFRGTADDVVDVARGEIAGAVLNWQYVLRVPARGREWELRFDDWMYLQHDGVLLNRAAFSKWGFRLGEVTLAFVKSPAR